MGRSRPGVLLTVAVLLAGQAVHAADSGTAGPPTAERPNILVAIADDWSFGHASCYGCTWVKTPAFDRVARDGILFTKAYTPVAKCAPSRAAILTGRNPWLLEAAANHNCFFPATFGTYPEALSEHGYFVGVTGKGWAPGVANDAAGRPRRMTGRPFNARKAAPPTPEIADNDYAGNFADFLDAAPRGAPWCFWYGSTEPHRRYEPGSGVSKGGRKPADIDRVPACWPDSDVVRTDMLDYAFEIEHFDRHLGRMLAELEDRGLLADTLVVVTSDNGMPFPHAKGDTCEAANHMPLAVMWPRGIAKPGRVAADFVSFIDLAPTFVEVAGLAWERTGMAPPTGRSLADVFAGRTTGRDHVLIGKERNDVGRPRDQGYPTRGLVTADTLYVHHFEPTRWPGGNPETGYLDTDGSPTKTAVLESRRLPGRHRFWDVCYGKRPAEQVFDLRTDPDCVENVAGRVATEPLRRRLFAELEAQGDPRLLGRGHVFDEFPYAREQERNFHERFLRGEGVKAGWASAADVEDEPLGD